MKKILLALFVIFFSLPCLSQTQKPVYVDGVNVYSKPKIYANSFDGYLNMRSTPSSNGRILGTFRNGEVPGYAIKQEGNWVKIYYRGVTGYVYKKYTASTPTIAVTIDIDGSWLQGIWTNDDGFYAYRFFDNGTYKYTDWNGAIEIGTYRIAANSVVLTPFKYEGYCEEERIVLYMDELNPKSDVIDVYEDTIGEMSRKEFVSPADADGVSNLTREEFFNEKASVKAALNK